MTPAEIVHNLTGDNSEKFKLITESLCNLLTEKNKNYGNSALSPLGIFSKENTTSGLKIRLDDKLMRVKNSPKLRKNDVVDFVCYGILLCISEDWLNFDEFID
jgi:hypothetical protein